MRLCLINKEIPTSWGISKILISKDKLVFDVFGNKFQGTIIIIEFDSVIVIKKNDIKMSFKTSNELFEWLDNSIK